MSHWLYYDITQYTTQLNVNWLNATTAAMQYTVWLIIIITTIIVIIIIIPFWTYIFAFANFKTLKMKYQGIKRNFNK